MSCGRNINRNERFPRLLRRTPPSALRLQSRRRTNSVQSTAAAWLLSNPLYPTYSSNRKLHRYALAVLYLSLDGPNWSSVAGWYDPRDSECNWSEITCDDITGQITKLNLYDNGLSGTLPPEIVMLSDGLQELILYSNDVRSPVDSISGQKDWSFLGALTQRRVLDLDENALGGTIHTELGKLVHIEKIYLGNNGITGTIPGGVFARKANY